MLRGRRTNWSTRSSMSARQAHREDGLRRFSVANPLDFRDQATLNLALGLRTLGQFYHGGDAPKVRMPGGTRMGRTRTVFVGPHDKPKPVAVVSARPGARREAGLEHCRPARRPCAGRRRAWSSARGRRRSSMSAQGRAGHAGGA